MSESERKQKTDEIFQKFNDVCDGHQGGDIITASFMLMGIVMRQNNIDEEAILRFCKGGGDAFRKECEIAGLKKRK